MLWAGMAMDADQAALQDRKHAFHAVRRAFSRTYSAAVIHGDVLKRAASVNFGDAFELRRIIAARFPKQMENKLSGLPPISSASRMPEMRLRAVTRSYVAEILYEEGHGCAQRRYQCEP